MKKYFRHSAAVTTSARWRGLRLTVKRRDGWQCVKCCGVNRLQVDHIKPVRSHPKLAFEISNLQTLCGACHSRKTREEIGLTPMKETRAAWLALVRALTHPKVENCNA